MARTPDMCMAEADAKTRPAGAAQATLPGKLVRVALTFVLSFSLSFHVQARLAYGVDVQDASEGLAAAEGEDASMQGGQENAAEAGTDDGAAGGSEQDAGDAAPAPVLESYAFVKQVEILQEDGSSFPADARKVELLTLDSVQDGNAAEGQDAPQDDASLVEGEGEVSAEQGDASTEPYAFSARVIVVPDSNNEMESYEYIVTSEEGLAAQTEGLLPDLKWELIVTEKTTDAEGKEITKRVVAKNSSAVIDPKTGKLTQKDEVQGSIRCLSTAGKHLSGSAQANYVSDEVDLVVTRQERPSDPEPAPNPVAVSVSYDANGGEGTMEPSSADDEGAVVLAECGFVPPEGKVFDAWNTAADGSGQGHAAGETVSPEEDLVLFAQWADETPSSDDPEKQPSSEDPEAADGKDGTGSNTGSSDASTNRDVPVAPDDGKVRVSISYTPVPLGQMAVLSPVLSGLGHGTFSYLWEESTDEGATWHFVESEDAQALLMPTIAENLGKRYRVTLYVDRIIDEEKQLNHVVSEPVVLEADENAFSVTLSYTPVPEGEPALFSVTSTALDASYEWFVSTDGGAHWETIAEASGMTHAVPTTEENLGNWYRVRATRVLAEGEGDKADESQGQRGESGQLSSSDDGPSSGQATSSAVLEEPEGQPQAEQDGQDAQAASAGDAAMQNGQNPGDAAGSGEVGTGEADLSPGQAESDLATSADARKGRPGSADAATPSDAAHAAAPEASGQDGGNAEGSSQEIPDAAPATADGGVPNEGSSADASRADDPSQGSAQDGSQDARGGKDAGASPRKISILSNIQMLVAVVADAEPIPIDKLSDPASFGPQNTDAESGSDGAEGADDISDGADQPIDGFVPLPDGIIDQFQPVTELPDEYGQIDDEPITLPEEQPEELVDPAPAPEPEPESEPVPAPEPQAAPEPMPAPEPAPDLSGLGVDPVPDVPDELETTELETDEPVEQLGARWREVSVVPPAEEIDRVLEDNPFAPLVAPFVVALLACGMVERLYAYRRQTRPSAARFAAVS